MQNSLTRYHQCYRSHLKDSDILDENEFQRQTIVGIAREASKDLRKSVLNTLLDHISSKYKGMSKFLNPGAILNADEVYSLQEYVEYMKEVARLTTFLSEDDKMKNSIDSAVKRLSYIRKEVIHLFVHPFFFFICLSFIVYWFVQFFLSLLMNLFSVLLYCSDGFSFHIFNDLKQENCEYFLVR